MHYNVQQQSHILDTATIFKSSKYKNAPTLKPHVNMKQAKCKMHVMESQLDPC